MSEQHLDEWHKRPYGWRADGVVETSDRAIHVTARKPHNKVAESNLTYILANGWTAGKNSMREAAIQATKFGHTALTLEYANKGTASALAKNVQDVVAVIDAQPREARRAAMGLSMGGAVVTMALEHVQSPVEFANLVASGKYIDSKHYSPLIVARRFLEEALEITEIGRSPRRAAMIGTTSVLNCIRRPQAVAAELNQLLDGTVHGHLQRVKERADAPYIRFWYGLNDRLIPAYAQVESVSGLPFDEVLSYPGGHGRLAYDASLSYGIFEHEARQLAGPSEGFLPLAA